LPVGRWRYIVLLMAAAAAACACAPSALIKPEDPSFDQGSNGFQSSIHTVTGAIAGPDEALLLQAEAFYQYRFELGPQGSRAVSPGMGRFRMQAYDGAIQLYEALLQRCPDSARRPLALYRLGWAYRNVSLDGFPRDPAQPLRELQKAFPKSPLARLASEALAVPYKAPAKAAAWSLLPGAGQVYVGRWGNGCLRLSLASAFSAAMLVPPALMLRDQRFNWAGALLSLSGLIGLQVTYGNANEDAKRLAVEFNEGQEARFRSAHLEAP
jgi:hypothetical protein